MMAGPITVTKIEGKIKMIRGKTNFTGNLVASSSAF
jgi:hypothetical protein